jgi:hypothetical protein
MKQKWCLALFLVMAQGFASDSTLIAAPTTVANGAGAGSCTYYFVDGYAGTVLPSSYAYPTGTNITLSFNNNGSATNKTTALPCAGTYKMIFTIELMANTDVTSITVTPNVVDVNSISLFPSGGSPTSFTVYPECNNSGYSGAPYCTIMEISGSGLAPLTQGDFVVAPVLTASSSVKVIGGQFILYSCPAGSTTC